MTRKPDPKLQAAQYQELWNSMVIHASRLHEIDEVAKVLFGAKARFQELSELTHVPWHSIAIIKYRECGLDLGWHCNIANGQRWDHKTTEVPRGRGPFNSWLQAGYDALVNCPPHAGEWKDWSIGGELVLYEEYNGEGYWTHGWANPYLWSFTNHYTVGKYASDGRYDPRLVDKEIGCAPLLSRLYILDKSIAQNPTPKPA